jgi:hypothetical protein
LRALLPRGGPAAQSGIAPALLNASRKVAGLLGVTIIGAVRNTVRASALRGGTSAPDLLLSVSSTRTVPEMVTEE